MDKRAELLQRVRDDAAAISEMVEKGTNVPLEQYVDRASLDGLTDSLGLEPEEWHTEDLERILIIRDGLYELRNKLRDSGDEAEHSVERLLGGVDRLYADLERAFRELNQDELRKAQVEVAALQRGPHLPSILASGTVSQMRQEASEVLVQSHVTIKYVQYNFLKIDRSNINFEVLKSVKLTVQRLSASVFAIKLSLEQSVVYQGIFKLLTDGADRIVAELKDLLEQLKKSYDKAERFVTEVGKLAEKGTRFARLISEFLDKAFAQADRTEETIVKLRAQTVHQGEAILCASVNSKGQVLLGGKNGNAWVAEPTSGRIAPRFRFHDRAVYSLAHLDDEIVIVGTEDGLFEDGSQHRVGKFNERIVALVTPPWGAKGSAGAIVSGSRDGEVRRWSMAEGLSKYSEDSWESVGKRVQCLLGTKDSVIAASGAQLVFLNREMRTQRTIRVPFEVTGMDAIDDDTLILCGEGNITHVNLASGAFSRIITASNTADYTAVRARDRSTFYFATVKGKVGVMEMANGEELGSLDVGFEVRGIELTRGKLLVYGGDWKAPKGRSAAFIAVEQIVQRTPTSH